MSTIDDTIDFEAQQGEQLVLSATLKGADRAVANLTGATVSLVMRPRNTVTPIALAGATTIVGASTDGTVEYTGTIADTARAGEMEATFIADYGAGVVKKFPDGKNDYLLGFITEKIA